MPHEFWDDVTRNFRALRFLQFDSLSNFLQNAAAT